MSASFNQGFAKAMPAFDLKEEITTTEHSTISDTTTGVIENVYNKQGKLIKVVRKHSARKIETYLDPLTSTIQQVHETILEENGDFTISDIAYLDKEKTNQTITKFRADGVLIRLIKRETKGLLVTYQANTEYDASGMPAHTTNYYIDPNDADNKWQKQIHWNTNGSKSLTEEHYYNATGNTIKYVKVLHNHINGKPSSQEIKEFDIKTHQISKREVTSFDRHGAALSTNTFYYDSNGQLKERKSAVLSDSGMPLVTRSQLADTNAKHCL